MTIFEIGYNYNKIYLKKKHKHKLAILFHVDNKSNYYLF